MREIVTKKAENASQKDVKTRNSHKNRKCEPKGHKGFKTWEIVTKKQKMRATET